ncbi:MAG: hypothetical protein AB7N80_09190 [Bdellovibrionales bacterium]
MKNPITTFDAFVLSHAATNSAADVALIPLNKCVYYGDGTTITKVLGLSKEQMLVVETAAEGKPTLFISSQAIQSVGLSPEQLAELITADKINLKIECARGGAETEKIVLEHKP